MPEAPGNAPQVVERIARFLPEEVRRGGLPFSGVLGARVAIEVSLALGLPARPLPVFAFVYNAPLTRRILAHGTVPPDDVIDRWRQEEPGLQSAHLGFEADTPESWGGHLVALLDEAFLVDAGLPRPDLVSSGLALPPVFTAQPGISFLRGDTVQGFMAEDLLVLYGTAPSQTGYERTRAWVDRQLWRPVVDRVLDRMTLGG